MTDYPHRFRRGSTFARMNRILAFIPNTLTAANAAFGVLGLVCAAHHEMGMAIYCLAAALVCDFADGLVARALRVSSELGKQLDSLADAITFGALPGFILFQFVAIGRGLYFTPLYQWHMVDFLAASLTLIYPLAAVFRLARFNLSPTSLPYFQGLPAPAAALVVACVPLLLEWQYHLNYYVPVGAGTMADLMAARRWTAMDAWLIQLFFKPVFHQGLALALAALMVSKMPMISLKFVGFGWAANRWRYSVLVWVVLVVALFLLAYTELPIPYIDFLMLPLAMMGYLLLSLVYAIFGRSNYSASPHEIHS